MSNQPPQWVTRALDAAAQKKKVLCVEGPSDAAVHREWIAKELGANWTNQVYLQHANGRGRLLSGLRWLAGSDVAAKDSIFGHADRDEWEPPDVADLVAEMPMLLVNQSRHSLESYFCDCDELEPILLAQDAESGVATFAPHLPALRQQIEGAIPDYVPNWALWHILQRADDRIQADAHYPKFFRDTCPLPPDANVQAKLQQWAGILDPAALFAAFDGLRAASLQRPLGEQLRSCVEPKLFFGQIIVAGAHGLHSIQHDSTDEWLIKLARWSPAMPADLQATLAPVLA